MGVQDVLSRKSGVIVGDDVLKLFNYAQKHNFAIPAIVRTLRPFRDVEILIRRRTSPRLPLSLHPSKLPATPSPPSSCRCPKVVPPTLPERYAFQSSDCSLWMLIAVLRRELPTVTKRPPLPVVLLAPTTSAQSHPPTASQLSSIPTTVPRSSCHGWTVLWRRMRNTLLYTASLCTPAT